MSAQQTGFPAETGDPLRAARRAVHRGRFRDAVEELAQHRMRRSDTAEWQLLMAMASWRLGNFAESRRAAERARARYRARGDTDGEMRAENVAAAGAFALGQLDKAREGFTTALQLAQRFQDVLMTARCLNNLGNVFFHLGQNAEALSLYSRAANAFEKIASLRGIAESWHNMGIVWRDEDILELAREATERAVDAAERLGDARLLGQTLAGRGETDALRDDLPLGRAQAEQAHRLARESDDRLTEITALRVLALIARRGDATDQAIELAQSATAIATDLANQWMIATTHQELGNSLHAGGQTAEAADAYRVAAAAYDRLGSSRRARNMRHKATAVEQPNKD